MAGNLNVGCADMRQEILAFNEEISFEEEEMQRIKDYLGCLLKIYCLIEYQVMRRRRRRRRRTRSRELRIT